MVTENLHGRENDTLEYYICAASMAWILKIPCGDQAFHSRNYSTPLGHAACLLSHWWQQVTGKNDGHHRKPTFKVLSCCIQRTGLLDLWVVAVTGN